MVKKVVRNLFLTLGDHSPTLCPTQESVLQVFIFPLMVWAIYQIFSQLDMWLWKSLHFVDLCFPICKWRHGRVVILSTFQSEGKILEAVSAS